MTFGSVSNKEDGPSNDVFKAVKDEIAEASSVEVLWQVYKLAEEIVNLPEIVAPVPDENLVDCCSSFTMDESVLETDIKEQFAVQGWMP